MAMENAMDEASVAPAQRPSPGTAVSRDLWPIIAVCISGYAIAGYMALQAQGLDQISLLMMQSNVW
jgi:hypothetical protein